MDETPKVICGHPKRVHHAKGMCRACYIADYRASKLASAKTEAEADAIASEIDYASPEMANSFMRIMWSWVDRVQQRFRENKEPSKSEVELGNKGATILSRAYIAERHVDETPTALPIAGLSSGVEGWLKVAGMKLPTKEDNSDA